MAEWFRVLDFNFRGVVNQVLIKKLFLYLFILSSYEVILQYLFN